MASAAKEGKQGLIAVRATRNSTLVVDQIQRALANGRYNAGDRLPPERELARQLGVSRNTLREATRILAADGVIEVRRGATGGIRVSASAGPDEEIREKLRETVDEIAEILDLRSALEAGGAYFAASRRTAEDLERIQSAFDTMQSIFDDGRMEEVARFWAADRAFHDAIGVAAGNERLHRAIDDARFDFLRPLGLVFSTIDQDAHRGHDEILASIRAGDPERSSRAARDHVEVTRSALLRITNRSA